MPGNNGQDARSAVAEHEHDPEECRTRVEALINTVSQYQDVYPVLQRGIQFLQHEISGEVGADGNDDRINCCIKSFIDTGALVGMVKSMLANLDSPAFIRSCFQLLIEMLNTAESGMALAICKTDILSILDKIVHNVMYQNEPACVQYGITILFKLVKSFTKIESGLWTQLVATTAQAMLTNSLDNTLELMCVLTLRLLFQLKKDIGIPPTSANVVLKTIQQCNLNGPSKTFAFGCCGGHLAAHKSDVNRLIRASVQASLSSLIGLALPPDKAYNEAQMTDFQTSAMSLLLSVVWSDEARAFLDSGGIPVIANIFVSGSVLKNVTMETALAQTLCYVSIHWPNEMWNEIQVNGAGVRVWIEAVNTRCEEGNDVLLYYLLAMLKRLLGCEGFSEKFTASNGVTIFISVLSKRQELPLSADAVVRILISVAGILQPHLRLNLCSLVVEAMLALETNQLDYVVAATLLISQESPDQTILSSENVRDIVHLTRSKLSEHFFIDNMLSLVANALLNSSARATFVDRAILQVVSKAISCYQWGAEESPGLNARLIICDIAHKLDISRNLSTIEPHPHAHAFNTQAISMEALDACCSVVGALAFVKAFVPLLIEEDSIQRIVGMLRYAKQELILRSECSFVQLVTTCFWALRNIVTAPTLEHVMEISTGKVAREGNDAHDICSRLSKCRVDDAIIGCLEEALRVEKCPPLLVGSGCQILQAVLGFPIQIACESNNRWIAVVTSFLQRRSTQERTRESLFATTLMVLSRGKQPVQAARGQLVKMAKVILDSLENSIQREDYCTLLQGECAGSIRILEGITKVTGSMTDTFVSRYLGVLGKLIRMCILSSSTSAQQNIVYFYNAIDFFASSSYVNRLINRLERSMTKDRITGCATVLHLVDDFKALETLLFSSQARKTIDAYHRLFDYLAALVENTSGVATREDYASFFLGLGCLVSQLLPTTQREEVINTALCQFAEKTTWHSMRWIAALESRSSSEYTLVVEFVLLRIISGYTVIEPALLMELLDTLNYLLRCTQCKEIVLQSSHISELDNVLWKLVYADIVRLEADSNGFDVAVSLLGIVSTLLSFFPDKMFSIKYEGNGSELLVRWCLGMLDKFVLDTNAGLTKFALQEEVIETTGTILQQCIKLGAKHVRKITQHQATRHAVIAATSGNRSCQTWCAVVLDTMIESHGLLYAELFLKLSPDPFTLLISFVDTIIHDSHIFSWNKLADCVGMMNGPSSWQLDCTGLFETIDQRSTRLIHGQSTVANGRRVKKHITESIACLSLKYGQLITNASEEDICLQDIVRSGTSFYELFKSAPNFELFEYSAVICLHIKIVRINALKAATVEELVVGIRQLLYPIGISDEVLADYIHLVVEYISPSNRVWQIVESSASVILRATQRLSTGLVRSRCLEKSLQRYFSALSAVCAMQWEKEDMDGVLNLLNVCSPDKRSQDSLLETVLLLPQGLLHLFGLAHATLSNDIRAMIMTFMFQHVNDIRHKTQGIGDSEVASILAVVRHNLAGKVGDTSQREWGQLSGSEMLCTALDTLKLFTNRKNCAVLCSDLGGVDILHNVLCAPSQYQDIIYLALQISCYLAGYGADLAHENTKLALQLLCIYVEMSDSASSARLAYLVLDYFFAVDPSKLNIQLIQQCRAHIIPATARPTEEMAMFMQQLYIIRQKVPISTSGMATKASQLQLPLRESEILQIISANCRRIVQVMSGPDECFYVDVDTSEKTATEPVAYSHLREAISQLRFVLEDPDMVMNRGYVSDFVPALCEILALHTTTTSVICIVMQILDQIAFVNASIIFSNVVNIPALFASCSLHQRLSVQFARHLARFCNNLTSEFAEIRSAHAELLLNLLFELLQNWKMDEEIANGCLSAFHILADKSHTFASQDMLALFNSTVVPYVGNFSIAWDWLKCVRTIVAEPGHLIYESVESAANIAVGIIRMFMSHSFMVRKALLVLVCIYREKQCLPVQHFIKQEGVSLLLTCLELNANDEWIGHSCLELLMSLPIQKDTFFRTVDQLVAANAAESILLVCKKNQDNASICKLCTEFIHRILEGVDCRSGIRYTRKKSELLVHLLEADVMPLLFDLLDNYSCRGDNRLLEPCLALLKSLTKDERLCESAEVLHGLQELQQTITRIWENNFDFTLVELAIDCLVNMACCDRPIGHGWRELPMWILEIADSIYNTQTVNTGMCVEKLIGILGRLATDSAISKSVASRGSFTILALLKHVGRDRSLEQTLYGLLCAVSEDIECTQILVVYDAIPIICERITCCIEDEDVLLNGLCFFDLLVLNIGESYPALQDGCVFDALELVTREHSESTELHRIANTILEKVSALDYLKQRLITVTAKPKSNPKLQVPAVPAAEKTFYDLLVRGGKFRVLWETRPDTVESFRISLAPSGGYLIFRRKDNSQLPRIERVFASQIAVCPQRSLVVNPNNTSKKLLKESFEGDCVLRMKIRDEDVLVKTSSTRERVCWDQALQWLCARARSSS